MKISVIVPTYKPKLDLITQLFESLHKQKLNRSYFEVLVVENGEKTPNLENIIKSLNINIHYLYTETAGANHARNFGIEHSNNDVIVLLDDDVIINDQYLNRVMSLFSIFNTVGIIGGKVELKFLYDKPNWIEGWFRAWLSEVNWSNYVLNDDQYIVSANMSFTKKRWKEVGGFDESVGLIGRDLVAANDEIDFQKDCAKGMIPGIFYDPNLVIQHLITEERGSIEYFLKKSFGQGYADARRWHKFNPNENIDNYYHNHVQGIASFLMPTSHIMEMREFFSNEETTRRYIRNMIRCKSEYLNGIIRYIENV